MTFGGTINAVILDEASRFDHSLSLLCHCCVVVLCDLQNRPTVDRCRGVGLGCRVRV